MGLLDDAIREHLELKRLRGADPGEVAREEHNALDPVDRGEDAAHDWSEGHHQGATPGVDDPLPAGSNAAPMAHPIDVGQETAEIDMNAVLASDTESDSDWDLEARSAPETTSAPPASSGDRAAPVAHPAHSQSASEESLQWEVPGEQLQAPAGHEGEESEAADAEKNVDDVLEETPDFLRETPDQERLWLEQRPPRNFDFNE